MKVTVLQENLARGLSTVSRAVSPRSTLPVLSNILIASDEGRLRLSATNLELGITCWIAARIDEEGSTTCGAESGSVPVSASSPALLISEIEIQKKDSGRDRPPLLPAPPLTIQQ